MNNVIDWNRLHSKTEHKKWKNHSKARQRKMARLASRQLNCDYAEIYELIARKLEMMRDYATQDSICNISTWRLEWMDRAIQLARHLTHQETYPVYINIKNQDRFKEASYLKLGNKYLDQEFYDIKAKHLLFQILTNYIDCWWD